MVWLGNRDPLNSFVTHLREIEEKIKVRREMEEELRKEERRSEDLEDEIEAELARQEELLREIEAVESSSKRGSMKTHVSSTAAWMAR